MFQFEELFTENKINKKKKEIKKKKMKMKKAKRFMENVIKPHIQFDSSVIDNIFFNENVTADKYGNEFFKLWTEAKKESLSKFYKFVKVPMLKEKKTKSVPKKSKVKKVVKRAKKAAKNTLKMKKQTVKKVAKKLAENIFYPSLLNEEVASKNAIKYVFNVESALNLFGGLKSLVSPIAKTYAIWLKKH